jgi:hypothetical protein
MPGRTKTGCECRYTRTLAGELHRGRWTESEDFVCFFLILLLKIKILRIF